jgi:Ras-related protein Rab-8A
MTLVTPKDSFDNMLLKVIIIGDSGVGKSNILMRFCENEFKTSYVATIGVDFKMKAVNVDGTKLRLQIWDTAGQERYRTITQTYYKGAYGIILTYSIDSLRSF